MGSCTTKTPEKIRILSIDSAVFFAVFYLCLWLIIDPKLIYHAFGRILYYERFSTGWGSLLESLTKIAGPITYVNGFLSQCFYFSWVGALIVTVIAWLFWLSSNSLFTLTKSYQFPLICYLYPAILLAIYTRYNHQLLIVLTVLSALIFLSIYMRTVSNNSLFDIVKFIAISLFLFYFAGSAFIILGLSAAFYELFVGRRKILGILFFIISLGAGFFCIYFFDIQVRFPNLQLLSASQIVDPWLKYPIIIMYFLPFLMLIQITLCKYAFRNKIPLEEKKAAHNCKYPDKPKSWPNLKRVLKITAPLVLIPLIFLLSFKKTDKLVLQISYQAHNKMWQKVLKLAQKCPKNIYSLYWNHDINRALYQTGQLSNKMFSYPQKTPALLLTTEGENKTISLATFAKRVDLFLELGQVGVAERLAYELMEGTNQCPFILEKLALINLAKNQNETAKTFLNTLSRDLIYGPKAQIMLKHLQTDPQLTTDKHVQYLRSVASDVDNTIYAFNADDFFRQLLDKNKYNKMAFEYMMAFYLLTGQVHKVAENIARLDDYAYMTMPMHYEEALALYIGSSRKRIDLKGHVPTMQTLQYVKRFDNIYRNYATTTNKLAARNTLIRDYKDSYIFYFVFEIPRAQK